MLSADGKKPARSGKNGSTTRTGTRNASSFRSDLRKQLALTVSRWWRPEFGCCA